MGNDNVNSPKHYMQGGKETIDIMADLLTPIEFEGYIKGNIIKYISRYKFKSGIEDLEKARWYLNKLINIKKNNSDADIVNLKEQFNELIRLP